MGKNSSHILKTALAIVGLVSVTLSPMAMAGHRYNDGDDYYNYNRHYNNRHHYNRHNRYGGGYYSPRHHDGGEVALGILTGGLLFYALTSNERKRHNNRTIYVQQQPVYAQPAQQRWSSPPAQPQTQFSGASCRQIREYQTTITVGNQTVPAYGQSCLQPDGSWLLGPAIPEPGN